MSWFGHKRRILTFLTLLKIYIKKLHYFIQTKSAQMCVRATNSNEAAAFLPEHPLVVNKDNLSQPHTRGKLQPSSPLFQYRLGGKSSSKQEESMHFVYNFAICRARDQVHTQSPLFQYRLSGKSSSKSEESMHFVYNFAICRARDQVHTQSPLLMS